METNVTVWLDEEYGYRQWRWETGMSEAELVAWWSNLSSVMPYFYSPVTLPGVVVEVSGEAEASTMRPTMGFYTAHLHCDDDSGLFLPSGEVVRHAGFVGPIDYES